MKGMIIILRFKEIFLRLQSYILNCHYFYSIEKAATYHIINIHSFFFCIGSKEEYLVATQLEQHDCALQRVLPWRKISK